MMTCANAPQVISLSDIFISPLEDMYVRGYPHFLNFIDNLQLLRYRAPRNRFAPTSHLKTSRETIHSILLVPNFGESTWQIRDLVRG